MTSAQAHDGETASTSAAPAAAPSVAQPEEGRSGVPVIVWRLASFALFFAVWEVMGRIPFSLALPPASDVFAALAVMIVDGELARAYGSTVPPLLVGVAITIVGGVLTGLLMGLSRLFEWFVLPIMVILQTAPVAAIIPLLTYFYGIDARAKILAVIILGMPLVTLNSYKGIRGTSPSLLDMSRSFLGSRMQTVAFVILPSASPMIFAGLRLGVSGAFIGIVLAELLITPTGIGDTITYNRGIARYDKMFAAIVSIIVIAAVTLALLQSLERRLFRPEQKAA
ncbi:MAG: ABC transporter permease [Azospirillaceae bacterium]